MSLLDVGDGLGTVVIADPTAVVTVEVASPITVVELGGQGPMGPQGPQGQQGGQGERGFQGEQGIPGPTGPPIPADQVDAAAVSAVAPIAAALAGAVASAAFFTYPTMAAFLSAPIPAGVASVAVLGRNAPGDTAPMTFASQAAPTFPKPWHVQSAALGGGVMAGAWWQLAMPTEYVEPLMFGNAAVPSGKSVPDYAPLIQAALDYHPAVGALVKVRIGHLYAFLSRGLRCPYPNPSILGAAAGGGISSTLVMGLEDDTVFDAPLLCVGRRSKAMRVVVATAPTVSGATQVVVDHGTDDEGNTIAQGNAITGPYIPAGTTVTGISGTTLTLSAGLTGIPPVGTAFVVQTAFTAQVVVAAAAGATSLWLSNVDDGYGAGLVTGDPITGAGIRPGTTVLDVTGPIVTLSATLSASVPVGTTVSAILPFLPAGLPVIERIGFVVESGGRFRGGASNSNGGAYDPATTTNWSNQITSGKGRHLKLVGAQRHRIRDCSFDRNNIQIIEHGCSYGEYYGCSFNGTWDHLRPGLQETIASFKIPPHVDGAIPTLPGFPNCIFGGGLAAPPRAVTAGTYTSNPAAAPGTAGSIGCYENIGPQYAVWVQECEGFVFNPRYVGGQNVNCVLIDPRGMISNSIKIALDWVDGARLGAIHVKNNYAGSWVTELKLVSQGRITGGACDDSVLIVDPPAAGNPCTVASLVVGDISTDSHRRSPFVLNGVLKATFGTLSLGGYNCLGGYNASDIDCAGIVVGGTSDGVLIAVLNAGGGVNDPSSPGQNGCKWGLFVANNAANVKIGISLAYNLGVPGGGLSSIVAADDIQAYLATRPTSPPASPGLLWLNGGILQLTY